jgi:hypothetical protein
MSRIYLFSIQRYFKSGYKTANEEGMSTGSINSLSSSYLQSVLATALQGTGLTTKPAGNSPSGIDTSSIGPPPDNSQLSPFAQLMSALQQLQQSDPTKYGQVTQQIAANLQDAAQTAQGGGNTSAANQLNQLATDFTNASKSGELPNIQDLAQAIGGHHHHHHSHPASAGSDSDSSASAGAGASSGTSQTLSQQLAAFQDTGTQSDPLNPMTIILNTLSKAGIGGSKA